ncbi:uncharacterized protein MYCFIDRAFT_176249 [Pseudocercospora fijiensis CIRAD86]|uniref:Uncharacterized protein n=1 Tax=Pseudocercospora fijiensis (strain CIRAD86) TaxID=383855 RepID=M2ZP51_PSEFD|nr:uncharacterized protein MYCFIDRAFT_176249 [Pseudocercospora fijiensis CIRAD86]EME80889.1 hypothetical protein MYCFIDRAFT_176249 [Pseudocercospora fijiensis CIRAD86]
MIGDNECDDQQQHCMELCFTHFDEHFRRFIHTFSKQGTAQFVFLSASDRRRAFYSKIPYIRFSMEQVDLAAYFWHRKSRRHDSDGVDMTWAQEVVKRWERATT